jgi:hypothetical protein
MFSSSSDKAKTEAGRPDDIPKQDLLNLCMKLNKSKDHWHLYVVFAYALAPGSTVQYVRLNTNGM